MPVWWILKTWKLLDIYVICAELWSLCISCFICCLPYFFRCWFLSFCLAVCLSFSVPICSPLLLSCLVKLCLCLLSFCRSFSLCRINCCPLFFQFCCISFPARSLFCQVSAPPDNRVTKLVRFSWLVRKLFRWRESFFDCLECSSSFLACLIRCCSFFLSFFHSALNCWPSFYRSFGLSFFLSVFSYLFIYFCLSLSVLSCCPSLCLSFVFCLSSPPLTPHPLFC